MSCLKPLHHLLTFFLFTTLMLFPTSTTTLASDSHDVFVLKHKQEKYVVKVKNNNKNRSRTGDLTQSELILGDFFFSVNVLLKKFSTHFASKHIFEKL